MALDPDDRLAGVDPRHRLPAGDNDDHAGIRNLTLTLEDSDTTTPMPEQCSFGFGLRRANHYLVLPIEIVAPGQELKPVPPDTPLPYGRLPLTILAALAALAAIRLAQEVLIPVVVAILIAFALDPIVGLLERIRLGRAIASAVLLASMLGAFGSIAYSLREEALIVLDELPEGARRIRAVITANTGTPGPMEKVKAAATEIEKVATAAVGEASAGPTLPRVQLADSASHANSYIWWGSMGIASWTGQMVVIFFLVYFLLASGDAYKRKVLRLAGPTLSEKKVSMRILKEIDAQIGRFLLVQIMTSVLVAIVTGLALKFLGLNQPAIWGLVAGILNSIPYFGAIMVSIGLALVAFLQFGTIEMAIKVSAVAFVITSLEGFLLTPAAMGKAAGINQVALFVGILFWSWMWGVVGMILAVPIMMVIRCVSDRVESLAAVAELLGERDAEAR